MPRCSLGAWQARADGRRRWQRRRVRRRDRRTATRARSPPGRPGRELHRGVLGQDSHSPARAERLRPGDVRGRGSSLAVAGLYCGCPPVGLRPVGRLLQPTRPAHPGSRRSQRASLALIQRVYALLFAGELDAAASLVEEVQVVTEATGERIAPYGDLCFAALRGREGEMSILATATRTKLSNGARGIGIRPHRLGDRACSTTVSATIRTRWQQPKRPAAYLADVSVQPNWGLVELVEAAARCGLPERGTDAVRRLSESTRASGTDWALGVEARSRALLSEGETADRLYLESDRAARPHPHACGTGPRASGLRRMAAARESPYRRTRAASRRRTRC